MIMRLDTYEQECKNCPSLTDCEDKGIGCYRVIATDDTYTTGHNEKDTEVKGTYQCFHCGAYSVVWQSDFSFEDYGMEGEGIVHACYCTNCGADIEYFIRLDEEETDGREG